MTVRQLLENTDSAELTEWQVFFVEDRKRQESAHERSAQDRRLMGG